MSRPHTVHGLFSEKAQRIPHTLALSCPHKHLTFAALDHLSSSCSHRLLQMAPPGTRIGAAPPPLFRPATPVPSGAAGN